jgi:hypothetical protein
MILPGCPEAPKPAGAKPKPPRVDPLPIQQVRAYPEAATGMFLPLADFENTFDARRGSEQLQHFAITPAGDGAGCSFVDRARTGAGAMEVTLPPGQHLVFTLPDVRDFADYSLLSMAFYSTAFRDDLLVTLATRKESQQLHRVLLRPGWNNVMFDIRPLRDAKGFDVADVRTLQIAFAEAGAPVVFTIDDIMLINNGRVLEPAPLGVTLRRDGLDYRVTFSDEHADFRLVQGADGLWRLGGYQAVVQLGPPGKASAENVPQIGLLGSRRIGQALVLEQNAVRIRLASTWFFPERAGEWASLAVRRIQWEYTFYGDGRWVTHVELNNAGGPEVGSIRILLPQPGAWAGDTVTQQFLVKDFAGPFGHWSFMCAGRGKSAGMFERNYLNPGHLDLNVAADGAPADGDADRDGFDESQGCYFLRAKAGHCRFSIVPSPEGLLNPVFRVLGGWKGQVNVNSEGLAIRRVASMDDGSALFVLPGLISKATAVEVTGEVR